MTMTPEERQTWNLRMENALERLEFSTCRADLWRWRFEGLLAAMDDNDLIGCVRAIERAGDYFRAADRVLEM